MTSRITPRHAQPYCLAALREALQQGADRFLYVLPPKQGKPTVAALFCHELQTAGRILFLSLRTAKLREAEAAFRAVYGEEATYGHNYEENPTILFATYQSIVSALAGDSGRPFARDEFVVIIYDAAQHAHTPLYAQLLNHFTGLRIGYTDLIWQQDRGEMLEAFGPVLSHFTFPEVYVRSWTCEITGKGYRDQLLAGESVQLPKKKKRVTLSDARSRQVVLQDREETAALYLLEETDTNGYEQVIFWCQNPEQAKRIADHLGGVALCRGADDLLRNYKKFRAREVRFATVYNMLTEGDDTLSPDAIGLYRVSSHPRVVQSQLAHWTSADRGKPLAVIDLAGSNDEVNTLRHLEAELRAASQAAVLKRLEAIKRGMLPEPIVLRSGPIFNFREVPYVIKAPEPAMVLSDEQSSEERRAAGNRATILTWEDSDPEVEDKLNLLVEVADEDTETGMWMELRGEMAKKGWLDRYIIQPGVGCFFFWPHGTLDELLAVLENFLRLHDFEVQYDYLSGPEAGEDIRKTTTEAYRQLAEAPDKSADSLSLAGFNDAVASGKPLVLVQEYGDAYQGVVRFVPINLSSDMLRNYQHSIRQGYEKHGGLLQEDDCWVFSIDSLDRLASEVASYVTNFVEVGAEIVIQEIPLHQASELIKQIKKSEHR